MEKGKQLKYNGRAQYITYLKNAGIEREDCAQYLQSRIVLMQSKENKSLNYFVRHRYGEEGSRINYGPMPCYEIQEIPIEINGFHGCVFDKKQFSVDTIQDILNSYITYLNETHKIKIDIEDIDVVKEDNPCIICTSILNIVKELMNNDDTDVDFVQTPNYFTDIIDKLVHKD